MKIFNQKNILVEIVNSRFAQHTCFWLFFFISTLLLMLRHRPFFFSLYYSFVQIIFFAIPVYFHFYLFKIFFNRKKYHLYMLSLIGIIIIAGISMNYVFVTVFKEYSNAYSLFLTISSFLIMTTAIKYAKRGIQQRLDFQKIKAKQLQTELNLLKAQINPHFLFNTLNNLFGLARKRDRRTADGIAQLSHLMRYVIYDSKVEQIELEKEVEQIKRLIDLQKLRFLLEDDIDIDFQVKGNITELKIPPMLLIPFVENAFKHGISLSKKSFIKIDLKVKEQYLHFHIINTIHRKKYNDNETESGLGLENVKRRLELLYPDGYKLEIYDSQKTFEVDLWIKV